MTRFRPWLVLILAAGCIGDPMPAGPRGTDVGDSGAVPDVGVADVRDPSDLDRDRDTGVRPDAPPDRDDGGETEGPRFVDIAIADNAVCALEHTGRLACWGINESRLLDDSDAIVTHAPFWRDTSPMAQIDGGASHFCGTQGGQVVCWGANLDGQSDPTAPGPPFADPRPVNFPGLTVSAPVDVGAGFEASCAVFEDEQTICWGANQYGVVNPSASANIALAPTVIAVPPARAVSPGARHACATTLGGELYCWGDNSEEQAIPGGVAGVLNPMRHGTTLFENADAGLFTCGATGDRVRCWGLNLDARLGEPDGTTSLVPAVPNVGRAAQVAVGATHACALGTDGTVTCWGAWKTGPPVPATRFASNDGRLFHAVAAGNRVTCATTLREVLCWGTNGPNGLVGQFETGAPISADFDEPTPVPIP